MWGSVPWEFDPHITFFWASQGNAVTSEGSADGLGSQGANKGEGRWLGAESEDVQEVGGRTCVSSFAFAAKHFDGSGPTGAASDSPIA